MKTILLFFTVLFFAAPVLADDRADIAGRRHAPGPRTASGRNRGRRRSPLKHPRSLAFHPQRIECPLIVQLELPLDTVEAVVGRATGFVCVNLAPAAPVSDQMLRRADLIVVNEVEADFYGDLLHHGGGRVVVTLGASGAVMYQRGAEIARAAPPKVKAVDATGAGDSFVGAITVALLEDMEPDAALRFACAAGAIAATRAGAQPSLPMRDEVDALLA